jgi:hypothetical protein
VCGLCHVTASTGEEKVKFYYYVRTRMHSGVNRVAVVDGVG